MKYFIINKIQKSLVLIIGFGLFCPEISAQTSTEPLETIAFGSCNRQDLPQPLWQPILENQPDLWIWLGDNIYGDTQDMQVLAAKYQKQSEQADYQKLTAQVPIIGIWDDHDFGKNDAGKEYAYRAESQQLMLDFLGVPEDAPQRKQAGAYATYTYGEKGKQIRVILLDARYFRDPIEKGENGYLPNPEGTVLGDEQWQWLEKTLKDSQADVHIIGSGIQMIPEEHRFEKWANFPKERTRLFDLIQKYPAQSTILLSGDRHIGEISKLQREGDAKTVWEVTSSGLTHSYRNFTSEPNQHRVGEVVSSLNFGILQFDWAAQKITLQIRGEGNKVLQSQVVEF